MTASLLGSPELQSVFLPAVLSEIYRLYVSFQIFPVKWAKSTDFLIMIFLLFKISIMTKQNMAVQRLVQMADSSQVSL